MIERLRSTILCFLLLLASGAVAQGTVPPTGPAPVPSPVSGIRNKISAGDLLSAESILETHRAKNGEDGPWLVGLSWLARGALLIDDTVKAELYADLLQEQCGERLSHGADLETDHDLEIAYGASLEVRAQLLEKKGRSLQAVAFLSDQLGRLSGPTSLLSRIHKRLNMLSLTGQAAHELEIEDFIGTPPPSLASLLGKPVVLFIWAEWCGDCKAQAAALAAAKQHYEETGLQVIALTRYYDDSKEAEKARIDSVWKASYAEVGEIPIVISTTSMKQYGGSSTPTFVFIDRSGIVRRYTPTRLTDSELALTLDNLTK
jgi:thiol-disulfide isomerase/thioredoxin